MSTITNPWAAVNDVPDTPEKQDRKKQRRLTKREREVVALVAQGLKNKQIADRLSIAERTVKNHLQSIFQKLHVANRLELAVYALRKQSEEKEPDSA